MAADPQLLGVNLKVDHHGDEIKVAFSYNFDTQTTTSEHVVSVEPPAAVHPRRGAPPHFFSSLCFIHHSGSEPQAGGLWRGVAWSWRTVDRIDNARTRGRGARPYIFLEALDESYKNNIGFAIIRAIGEK